MDSSRLSGFYQIVVIIPSRRIPNNLKHLHWYKAGDNVFGVEINTQKDLDLLYQSDSIIIDDIFPLECLFHELTELLLV